MRPFTDRQLLGAKSLLREGLRLTEGTSVLLLYQQEFEDAALCVSTAAAALDITVEQRRFAREDFLGSSYPAPFAPPHLLRSNPIPLGIVLVMEWSEETTGARLSLLKDLQQAGARWRVASMPGVTLADFPSCAAELDKIEERAQMVFAVLARARLATLITEGPDGVPDILKIPLGFYCPIISTGRISDGCWGNFPSGETFIVPNEYAANGSVTVRGSFPNHALAQGDWVRFVLRRGRIVAQSVAASSDALRRRFMVLFFKESGAVKSLNANALAELGVGTNDSILSLTGNPVFDEKQLGTVHIAFGRNDQFGGSLTGSPHHDVTCTNPSLVVADVDVIKTGLFGLSWSGAAPLINEMASKRPGLSGRFHLTGTPAHAFQALGQPRLSVTYSPSRGDQMSFVIATGVEAELADAILQTFQRAGSMSPQQLQRTLSKNPSEIAQILRGLVTYRLAARIS